MGTIPRTIDEPDVISFFDLIGGAGERVKPYAAATDLFGCTLHPFFSAFDHLIEARRDISLFCDILLGETQCVSSVAKAFPKQNQFFLCHSMPPPYSSYFVP